MCPLPRGNSKAFPLFLQLTKIRKLTLPPAFGYGDHAVGPIPANSTLSTDMFTRTRYYCADHDASILYGVDGDWWRCSSFQVNDPSTGLGTMGEEYSNSYLFQYQPNSFHVLPEILQQFQTLDAAQYDFPSFCFRTSVMGEIQLLQDKHADVPSICSAQPSTHAPGNLVGDLAVRVRLVEIDVSLNIQLRRLEVPDRAV